MKKLLSLFLALLLAFSLSVPALADETGSNPGDSPEVSAPAPEPLPAPSPEPTPAPAPEPVPEPAPLPPESDTPSVPDTIPDIDPAPDPALPEIPAESGENYEPVENPPMDVADPSVSSVGDSLGELPFDVTQASNGDIIIEEHSYTRTVDILDASFFDDLPTVRSVLVSIFGEYQPKTQTVSTYYDGQLMETSTEYVPGIAGMDLEWIAGVVVFTVLLYCLMKLLGGMVK